MCDGHDRQRRLAFSSASRSRRTELRKATIESAADIAGSCCLIRCVVDQAIQQR